MARPMWKGAISFGLVNVPVELVPAVTDQQVRFHRLHDKDHMRLVQRMVCPEHDTEVDDEHTVRGYEVARGQYVIVDDAEVEALLPAASKALVISDFVDLAQIDPVYYDKPYYLRPQAGSERSYRLLVEVMARAKKVGIAQFVMHRRGYLAALRPVAGVLCLEIMRFADEVVPAESVVEQPESEKISEREYKVAEQLVAALAGDFEPARYHDDYREQLAALLEKKGKGQKIELPAAPEEEPEPVINLLEALEASVKAAKQQQKKRRQAA